MEFHKKLTVKILNSFLYFNFQSFQNQLFTVYFYWVKKLNVIKILTPLVRVL